MVDGIMTYVHLYKPEIAIVTWRYKGRIIANNEIARSATFCSTLLPVTSQHVIWQLQTPTTIYVIVGPEARMAYENCLL